ncbi:MAG: hypothetical protein P8P81_07620 [Bacteroidia bacterium]|nr:hypothetical protein [Bacteroidia bacterium]
MSRNNLIWLIVIIIDAILVFNIDSTFDGGDSILHYLQAHQAMETTHYFMDMWAKPIFILLAFPFAKIGWIGMKTFNMICILVSALGCKRISEHYKTNGWYGVILCFFAYSFFLVQSSGLTEPLFTVILTWVILFELNNKSYLSYTLLSFLPFVRSEGYIIVIIFLIYSLINDRKKFIPFMTLGTIIYGIIGIFYHNDFLWMFNQNPYSGIEYKYGNGSGFHFIEQLPYIIGLPIFILFCLGLLHFTLNIKNYFRTKDFFLIYGITIGYIVAHSIFWRFGLFHSFGLTRVLIVIIPLISIIAYRGILWIENLFTNIDKKIIRSITFISILTFPFIKSPMALSWQNDIKLNIHQEIILTANKWLIDNKLNLSPTITNAYFLALASNRIIDNDINIIEMKLLHNSDFKTSKGSLIVWDSYFAVTDSQISESYIVNNFNVKKLKQFIGEENYKIVIYQVL